MSDNDLLWSTSCLMFIHDGKEDEWKQRGFGNFNICKYNDRKMIRVIMRRNITRLLCVVFYITPNIKIEISKRSKRTCICDYVNDDSDDVGKKIKCAFKFVSEEISEFFKNLIEMCQQEEKDFDKKIKLIKLYIKEKDVSTKKKITFNSVGSDEDNLDTPEKEEDSKIEEVIIKLKEMKITD